MNKEERKEYNRNYYIKNKEKIKEIILIIKHKLLKLIKNIEI